MPEPWPTPPLSRAARRLWQALPEGGRQAARPALHWLRQRLQQRLQGALKRPGRPGSGAAEADRHAPRHRGVEVVPPELVSVLIPTLNAGGDFARNLDQIRAQRGIRPVEIVVADSGSTDGTVATARAMGAQVLEIEPATFNHGGTRNRLADMASGDVLLMTVQDARLVGPHAIRDLLRLLRSRPGIAGVSAAQLPRADTDLFSSYLTFAHTAAMAFHRPPDPGVEFAAMSPTERRSACALDDVCALIDRAAWQALRFREVNFAEDLDLAVRAAQRGLSIIASPDVAVVHSHGRPAVYHLRRFAQDRLWVARLVGDNGVHPAATSGLQVLAGSARRLLRQLAAASTAACPPQPAIPKTGVLLSEFLREATALLEQPQVPEEEPQGELADLDALLALDAADCQEGPLRALSASLVGALAAPSPIEFAQAQIELEPQEARGFLAKFAGMVIGSALGDALRADPDSALAYAFRVGV